MDAGSVDAIITDLPYGTTACAWDTVIPFAPMWGQVKRLLKPRGVFVTTASQPFTSALVMSNPKWFRYAWVWDKVNRVTGFANSKVMPLKRHEDVLVFAASGTNYYPQMGRGQPYNAHYSPGKRLADGGYLGRNGLKSSYTGMNNGERWPASVLAIKGLERSEEDKHPTQKPVALYAYLIRTYTNAGDTVLDFCMGSGTTGVAAIKEGRRFVGVELDDNYFAIAKRRIEQAQMQLPLFAVDEGSMGANEKPALAPALIQGEYPTLPA